MPPAPVLWFQMYRLLTPLAASLVLWLLAACATTAPAPQPPAATAPPLQPPPPSAAPVAAAPDTLDGLTKGLPAAEIVRLWGLPKSDEPFDRAPDRARVLTYEKVIDSTQRQVATSTQDRVYVDPMTGAERTVPEPVYSQQTIELVRTVELLVVDGQLAEWKVRQHSRTSLN